MKCPNCGQPMEYIEPEPDVGISGGWSCECGEEQVDESDQPFTDDEDDDADYGLDPEDDDEGDEW